MDKKNIETILPLTPLQQGFLWHSQSERAGAAAGLIQMQCRLVGSLNHALFEQAWQQTVDRHAQLRASVHWRNVKQPVSVILKSVGATVDHLDWRNQDLTDESLADAALMHFLSGDLESGLQIEQAPVSRMTLIQTSDQSHELVWTCHHLLLDGWSGGLVLDEVFARYDALKLNKPFTARPSARFADYLKWLKTRDVAQAEHYWTGLLADFDGLPKLGGAGQASRQSLSLGESSTRLLMAAVRESRTTINPWLQCAWAIVLAQLTGRDDIVYGTSVSGRQIDFSGADQLVGMLINVIPVRAKLSADQAIGEQLKTMQAQSLESLQYATQDLSEIQTWSRCAGQLFDSLVVVENQPSAVSPESVRVENQRSGIASSYGVTVIARPGEDLALSIITTGTSLSSNQVQSALEGLRSVLLAMEQSLVQSIESLRLSCLPNLASAVAPERAAEPTSPTNSDALPSPLLEEKIRRVWQRVLGIRHLQSSDSFFDLGGTSVLAMVMFNRLDAELGIRLPPTTLLEHGSVTKLVELIDQNGVAEQWSDVVAIQIDGDKPPLFVPDTTTDLLIYRHLAREMGKSQPIYGLSARNLSALPLSEVATRLVAQVQSVQVQGPYFLAGLSGAGPLAWLMAQQLEEQGQKVEMLILFDCLGPDYPRLLPPMRRALSALGRAARVVSRKITQPGRDRVVRMGDPLTRRIPTPIDTSADAPLQRGARVRALARAVTRHRPLGEQLANLVVLGAMKIPAQSNLLAWAAFLQALWIESRDSGDAENPSLGQALQIAGRVHHRLYSELKPFSGRVEFFKASERPPATEDDDFCGWRMLARGEFHVHKVSGGHLSLIEPPQVENLARILTQSLAEAQSLGKVQSENQTQP
ncbi:MAG: condensation domain-containing protein [Burkholderiaceae bacterium]